MWCSLPRYVRELNASDPRRVSIAEVSFRSMGGGVQPHSQGMFDRSTSFGVGDGYLHASAPPGEREEQPKIRSRSREGFCRASLGYVYLRHK